jgi:hypothetical protein
MIKIAVYIICFFLINTVVASSNDSIVHKGNKIYVYNKHGMLIYTRQKETYLRKGFAWKYDSLGVLVEKGHKKIGEKYGKWVVVKNGKRLIKHYTYGVEKTERYTKEGKKLDLILTYGYRARMDMDVKEHRYVLYKSVAGCVVSPKIKRVAMLHNGSVRLKKRIRYGKNWE